MLRERNCMGVQAIVHHAEPAGGIDVDDLVVRVRSGDLSAFEGLYRAHAGRIYAICLRMSSDSSRAEELTQETFIRAWEKLGTFRGESDLSAWLRRLAINVVLGDRRSRSRRQDRESPLAEGIEPRDPRPVGANGAGQVVDLERAIATLPQGARDVYILHDVEGYRHAEVARMLGVATGTSKAQLHRARRLLREALDS